MPADRAERSWTLGPAKTGAAGFLGGAAVIATAWTISTRGDPPPDVSRADPAPIVETQTPAVPAENAPVERASAETTEDPPGLVPATPIVETASPDAIAADPDRSAGDPSPLAMTVAINSASAEEIQLLPNVGPVLAQRIVAFRDQHGRIRSIWDLQRVKGIGPKTADAIRPHVTFD